MFFDLFVCVVAYIYTNKSYIKKINILPLYIFVNIISE